MVLAFELAKSLFKTYMLKNAIHGSAIPTILYPIFAFIYLLYII